MFFVFRLLILTCKIELCIKPTLRIMSNNYYDETPSATHLLCMCCFNRDGFDQRVFSILNTLFCNNKKRSLCTTRDLCDYAFMYFSALFPCYVSLVCLMATEFMKKSPPLIGLNSVDNRPPFSLFKAGEVYLTHTSRAHSY